MHPKFADWYQPVTFGHDRDVFELRWKSIEAVLNDLDADTALDLVLTCFKRNIVNTASLEWFREKFKEVDPTFKSIGNENEILTLAGCVLAICCLDDEYTVPEVALAILTTSACGTFRPELMFDLVGKAEHRIELDGAYDRKRPEFGKLSSPSKKLFAAALTAWGESPAVENLAKILSLITDSTIAISNNILKEFDKQLTTLQHILSIQDEELQMLWWVVGRRSSFWKKEFEELDAKARPILLGYESTVLTKMSVESPSIRAIFARAGIDKGAELTIPEAVNACGIDNLKIMTRDLVSPDLFPLSFAIQRAIETDADETWIPVWAKKAGLDPTTKISGLDLAVQFYRECKLSTLLIEEEE